MENTNDINSELESFREQWRAEVRARNPSAVDQKEAASSISSPSHPQLQKAGLPKDALSKRPVVTDSNEDHVQGRPFDGPKEDPSERPSHSRSHAETGLVHGVKEPVTALDCYEEAVEKEAQGSLGESLRLYRKAFRVSKISTS